MKYLLYPIALLLCATSFAQTPTSKLASKLDYHHKLLLNQLLHQQFNQNTALKTTTTKERVIGESIYSDDVTRTMELKDSSVYKYSGARGSSFDYYYLDYTSLIPQHDDNEPIAVNFDNRFGTAQSIFSDTAILWLPNFVKHSVDTIEKVFDSYNMNNTLLDCHIYFTDTPTDSTYYHNIFNSSDDITAAYTSISSGPTTSYDSNYKRYFTYNATGQLVQDSIYQYTAGGWLLVIKYFYKYDSSNNLITVLNYSWDSTYRDFSLEEDDMTYYDDHKLKTISSSEWSHTLLKDSIGYVTGSAYPIYFASYQLYADTPALIDLRISHINARGLPDTITQYSPSVTIPVSRDTIFYDTLNSPTAVHQDGTIKRFYYETYTTTQVPTIFQSTDNIKIYPNPTTNQIYINLADATKNKQMLVNLINTNGQLIRTESIPPNTQTWQTSIADLTPGTYFISICDRAGNKLHSQAIIKQ
ncbi:MAG TPA: T9SS type A sorting domain-containing protein [Flavipsychrobacter sp.]|nr:T9SS type A sorting domain-containing protein [Flavipsychrobacter sp.]